MRNIDEKLGVFLKGITKALWHGCKHRIQYRGVLPDNLGQRLRVALYHGAYDLG